MSSRVRFCVRASILTGAVVIGCLASAARAETVAFWEFNGDSFLDSSVGSHTLSVTTAGVSQVDNTASFSGGVLSADIDLRSYRQVTVSWDQYNSGTPTANVVWEHSANYNGNPGAIVGTIGSANIRTDDGSNAYNIDEFSVGSGWQHFSAAFNLDAVDVADVVKVTGSEIGWASPSGQGPAPESFINALFNIGARQGGSWAFTGQLDNVKIEGIPEPSTVIILASGLAGLLAYAWRKRK